MPVQYIQARPQSAARRGIPVHYMQARPQSAARQGDTSSINPICSIIFDPRRTYFLAGVAFGSHLVWGLHAARRVRHVAHVLASSMRLHTPVSDYYAVVHHTHTVTYWECY